MPAKTKTQKLKGRFNWDVPEITTSFLQGQDVQSLYDSLGEYITQLGGIAYASKTKILIGSTPFLAARVDTLIRPLGIRVANLRDLSRPEVMHKAKASYYTDAPVLVLRSMRDSYKRNLPLIKRIAEEVEEANGKLELPVMISGFDVKHWQEDKKGYGIDIIRRDDFKAIHDERLDGKYNFQRFSEVDNLGLPKFDVAGNRTWHARYQGLSRLCLVRGLVLGSDNEDLAGSDFDGWVVLVKTKNTKI